MIVSVDATKFDNIGVVKLLISILKVLRENETNTTRLIKECEEILNNIN